ncbi:MAG: DUF2147 domain-containing protein [Rhodospirillales bacterium]|nr:DUF2147 domain-containing protein [Rhodospirillales bacterium]MBN8927108.1 DUF2147 domain-containing protein [Rhodospirillales bacterium]
MPRVLSLLALLIASLLAVPVQAAAPPITGDWLVEGGDGVFQIAQCGQGLCGRLVGIQRDPGDPMPVDVHGAPQCGLTLLTADATPDEDGAWHGYITDPRSGTAYHAILRLSPRGQLLMRGYVGIPLLGQTQTWTRFIGRIGPDCRFMSGFGPQGTMPQAAH